MRFFRKNKKGHLKDPDGLSFDEVLFDARSSDALKSEGQTHSMLEQPFSRASFYAFAFFIIAIGVVLLARTFYLSINNGAYYAERAEANHIRRSAFTANRGVIYDRKGRTLVQNVWFSDKNQAERRITNPYAYAHVIGFIGSPNSKDIAVDPALRDFSELGRDGVEYSYDKILRGGVGEQLEEVDAKGNVVSAGFVHEPRAGKSVTLTLDGALQEVAYKAIQRIAEERGFQGGALVAIDVVTGEILALVSYPSFDANLFSEGISQDAFGRLVRDRRSPLLNRAIAGRYPPGSTIKPYLALAALEENTISPEKKVYSSGSISVPDPYRPGKKSVFLDWKAHGWVDMRRAIAVSSNVYFYSLGGGYKDVRGLGVRNIKKWLKRFGFGEKTGIDLMGEVDGILPDPDAKPIRHPDDPIWRIGDTYHASIGQGDTVVTPLQAAVALARIASGSFLVRPRLLLEAGGKEAGLPHRVPNEDRHFKIDGEKLRVVHEGMRLAVTEGTAKALSWLPFPVAGKTGTAEFGYNDKTHSWFIGFAPYEKPRLGLVVFFESGPRNNLVGGVAAALEVFNWISKHGGVAGILSR